MSDANPFEVIYVPLALSLADLWRACIDKGVVPPEALQESIVRIHTVGVEHFGDAPVVREIADLIAGR